MNTKVCIIEYCTFMHDHNVCGKTNFHGIFYRSNKKTLYYKTLTEFAKRTGNLLKKVLVPLKSLDSAFENDRCIFQVYRCIFF